MLYKQTQKTKMKKGEKKIVKVCLHSSEAKQISLQFNDFFDGKKLTILISRGF